MVNNGSDFLRLVPHSLAPNPLPLFRKLPGPRYDLQKIQQHIGDVDDIRLITQKCNDDVLDLSWTLQNVLELLHAATSGDFRDSEWCATGNGYSVDCDSYALNFDDVSGTRLAAAPKI